MEADEERYRWCVSKIFAYIGRKYSTNGRYWTNTQIKEWCDKNDVYYESTDKRADLVERIKQAGYK